MYVPPRDLYLTSGLSLTLQSFHQADYEKALEKAQATPELLKRSLFPEPGQDRYANCLVAQETKDAGAVVGMALASLLALLLSSAENLD